MFSRRRFLALLGLAPAAAATRLAPAAAASLPSPVPVPAPVEPPAPEPDTLSAAAFDEGSRAFVAIGDRGHVQTSADGVIWRRDWGPAWHEVPEGPAADGAAMMRAAVDDVCRDAADRGFYDPKLGRNPRVLNVTSREQAVELYGEGGPGTDPGLWADPPPPASFRGQPFPMPKARYTLHAGGRSVSLEAQPGASADQLAASIAAALNRG